MVFQPYLNDMNPFSKYVEINHQPTTRWFIHWNPPLAKRQPVRHNQPVNRKYLSCRKLSADFDDPRVFSLAMQNKLELSVLSVCPSQLFIVNATEITYRTKDYHDLHFLRSLQHFCFAALKRLALRSEIFEILKVLDAFLNISWCFVCCWE